MMVALPGQSSSHYGGFGSVAVTGSPTGLCLHSACGRWGLTICNTCVLDTGPWEINGMCLVDLGAPAIATGQVLLQTSVVLCVDVSCFCRPLGQQIESRGFTGASRVSHTRRALCVVLWQQP